MPSSYTNWYVEAVNDSRGYPRWDGSSAQRLLKLDVTAGAHMIMKPQVLQSTRDEYKPFPLKVFIDHIYQEKKSRLESPTG